MAGRVAPINVNVLDWAVSNSGFSDSGLAAEAKLTSQRLREIRTGQVMPRTGELRKLAKALDRPIAFFFLPGPPQRTDPVISFRPPVGRSEERPLNNQEQAALRSAMRWQKIGDWIQGRYDVEAVKISLPVLPKGSNPIVAAKEITTWLGWNVSQQRATQSSYGLLRELRMRLEARGIFILQYSLGHESCRGFSLPHPTTPLIALNSSFNAAARVFSIIHECAHLLRGDRAVCGSPRNDNIERWCERTAALVLIPSSDLFEYLGERGFTGKVSDIKDVARIANRYFVSLRAVAVRLGELNRAETGLYAAIDRIAEYGGPGFAGPNVEPQTTPVIRLRELGTHIPRLLLDARALGILSDTAVRRYLDVNGAQLDDISARIERMAAEV